ncbi:MAG: LPS export ABC transporter permease LptG [Candidatus Eisenbacteria bacterium]|nr:LPS export ABC transporter permease LptG [Candidatus Eisenbacteria bacterium]
MRILDKYVLREFLVAFSLALLFFMAIFVVVDLFEKIDTFIDYKAPPLSVARFYLYGMPYIVILVLPVAMLLSCFLTFGQMARRNELMAMSVSGVDFLRTMAPVLMLALLCCGFSLALGELVVPACNKAKEDTMRTVIKKMPPSSTTRRANVNYLGTGGRIFLIKLYDSVEKSMKEVVIQEFGSNTLERRIDAAEARWDGTQWVFENGMIRSFEGGVERASQFSTLTIPGLRETPEDFAKQEAEPDEMNFVQLTRYVSRVRESGGRIQKYLVELHMKLAFPLTNLIVTLVGASLSTRVRRGTLALGFGLSLLISFTYYGFIKTGQALGHSGALPPFVAAWMGNVFFGGLGIFLLLRARR